jgi:hypothetical protein
MTSLPYQERKRGLTGPERAFECESLMVSPRLAIVRYVFRSPFSAGGNRFEAGGYTEGFFWRNRNYNLYHILDKDGQPVADRFDVVDHVSIQPNGVRYDDLLLDVWLYPDGRAIVEDEDEVAEAIAAGALSVARQSIIERTRDLLLQRGRQIVQGAVRELDRLR